MAITLADLTVGFAHLDRNELLADWRWLIGSSKLPILLAASGDAFVQDADDGSIHVLDVAAGELTRVAGTTDEFRALLSDEQFVADHFALDMIGDLKAEGRSLARGQIFSFRKPPVLGGEYVLDNIGPTDIEIHFSLTGQIHRQARAHRPGTIVAKVRLD